MATHSTELSFKSGANGEMRDLTGEVSRAVAASGVTSGLATVCVIGSTCAVTTIEYEPGLIGDITELLDSLIPQRKDWRHNATWDEGNGHAHLRASLIGPSVTIPVVDGRLTLGTWQQIAYFDFDVKPRSRRVVVAIVGD